MRSDQEVFKASPTLIQGISMTVDTSSPWMPTLKKATQESTAPASTSTLVRMPEALSPRMRPKKPAIKAPARGIKTIAGYIVPQPLIELMSSTAIEPRFRK